MTRMIDPNFDPLQELERLKQLAIQQQHEIIELGRMFEQLVKSHNAQSQLIKQITEQNTELLSLWAYNNTIPK